MATRATPVAPDEGTGPTTIHPVTLRFGDRDLERAFRADWDQRTLRPIRVATILGVAMYAAFALVDVAVVPDHVPVTWAIRFALIIPLALLVLAASFTQAFRRHMQLAAAVTGTVGGLGIVAITLVTGELGQQYYAAGILLVTAYLGVFTRLRFVPAAAAIGTVVAVYTVTLVGLSGLPPLTVLNDLAFVAAMVLVSLAAAYAFERTARHDFLRRRVSEEQAARLADALANVRELSGLIPICAWCKKIRDDDGYWQKLESYLAPRSRAQFSHGMCPECLAIHGEGSGDAPASPRAPS